MKSLLLKRRLVRKQGKRGKFKSKELYRLFNIKIYIFIISL
jgi:hypothetical protein